MPGREESDLRRGRHDLRQQRVSGIVDLVAIHASLPLALSNGTDNWDVQAVETSPDNITTWSLVAYAVCVTAT